jgi:hypothetical protein
MWVHGDVATPPTTCPRCRRALADLPALATQAEALLQVVSGALSVARGAPEIEAAYGGAYGLRRALEEALEKADALALEHARSVACLAGTCMPRGA